MSKVEFDIRNCYPTQDFLAGLKDCLSRFGDIQQDFAGFMETYRSREAFGIRTLVAVVNIPSPKCSHPDHVDGVSCLDYSVACHASCSCCVDKWREGHRVIGTLSFFIEPKFIHNGGKVAHIEDVCVALGYEGSGVGSSLVNAAKAICARLGCYKAILDCSDANMPFYQKLGFRHHENCMRIDFGS